MRALRSQRSELHLSGALHHSTPGLQTAGLSALPSAQLLSCRTPQLLDKRAGNVRHSGKVLQAQAVFCSVSSGGMSRVSGQWPDDNAQRKATLDTFTNSGLP